MKKFLLFPFLAFSVLGATPTLTNFNARHFIVDATQVPTNIIRLNLNPSQFDTNADSITITITNIAGLVGSSLWTNSAGVLQPITHINGTNQFTIAEATGWTGSGTNAFFDDGTFNGVATINQTDGAIAKRANAYELEDLASGVGLLNNDGANNFTWTPVSSISDGTNTTVVQLGPFTPGRYPIANGTNTLTDGSFYASGTTNVALDVALVFGPGTTNVLYRNGNDLVYTNGGTSTFLKIVNGSGFDGQFGVSTGNNLELLPSSGFIDLHGAAFITGNFVPATANNYTLGNSSQTFLSASLGTSGLSIYGYNTPAGGTNYSRLAISHSGTNGAVVFDSQSAGTAGDPRMFAFQTNGVDLAAIGWTSNARGLYTAPGGGTIASWHPSGYYDYANGTISAFPGGPISVLGYISTPYYVVSGTTNQVVFGATNAPPVDSATIVKWISVSVAGESDAYRIPLYK